MSSRRINRIRRGTMCLLNICTYFSFVIKTTNGVTSFQLCYSNSNGETQVSSFPHFLPVQSGIFFTYNLKWKRLSSRDAFFSSLSPLSWERWDIKHAITTTDLNCIYRRNNFETFSDDLLSLTPLARTLSQPFSAFFSNLAFKTTTLYVAI